MDGKKVKLEEKEDRISDLPDSLVHHILSFLPSTKQAIQTGVLSKRWRNQWTQVPVVILQPSGMSQENFFKFIETTLCFFDRFSFKIKRLIIEYGSGFDIDPQFDKIISLAIRKNVEDLKLRCYCRNYYDLSYKYMLPELLFSYANLFGLIVSEGKFMPGGTVNWKHLKQLFLFSCILPDQVTERILSGCPLLEWLYIYLSIGFTQLVIASKSLKRLDLGHERNHDVVFLCPNLETFNGYFTLSNQAIESLFSGSPSLKSLELDGCNGFAKLVITSKLLRRLVLKKVEVSVIEISGPNLEELEIENLSNVNTFKLMDVPFSVSGKTNWSKAFVNSNNFVGSISLAAPQIQELNDG